MAWMSWGFAMLSTATGSGGMEFWYAAASFFSMIGMFSMIAGDIK